MAIRPKEKRSFVIPMVVPGIVGIIVLIAAILKARQFMPLPVLSSSINGQPDYISALIAWEIFLGLWLISGALPAYSRRIAIGCFSAFACYALYGALAGSADCGCFGQVHVNPWFTAILDVTIILALLLLAEPVQQKVESSQRRSRKWPVAAALGTGLATGIASAMLHPKPVAAANGLAAVDGGNIVILEPHKWIGHRFPLFAHLLLQRPRQVSFGKQAPRFASVLQHGSWIVMFYHANCDECRQTIPIYESLAKQNAAVDSGPRVAFIRVPSSDPSTPQPPELFHTNTALHGTLDDSYEWFATTPTVVELKNGVAIATATGPAAMNLNWVK